MGDWVQKKERKQRRLLGPGFPPGGLSVSGELLWAQTQILSYPQSPPLLIISFWFNWYTMIADILSTPSPGAENDGHQWIQSEKTRCLGKSGKRNGKNKLWISILGSGIDVLDYLNDWLGWFYSGYSGFHPFQKII